MATYPPVRQFRNRKSRGRGLRTTKGCLTCRKRHIKCDETKPICGPCVKNSKPCQYTLSTDTSETTITDAAHQIPTQQSPQDLVSNDEQETDGFTWTRENSNGIVHSSFALGQLPGVVHQCPTALRSSPSDAPSVPHTMATGSFSSPGTSISAAAVRWFGLLANDAARETPQLSTNLIEYGNGGPSLESAEGHNLTQPSLLPDGSQIIDYHQSVGSQDSTDAGPRDPNALVGTLLEEQVWQRQVPIKLLPREHFLFENFVERVSQLIDLFDPTSQFSVFVPHLAMRNSGLMNAILALSCRHLSLNPQVDGEQRAYSEDALQYYYRTLHYVQKGMRYFSYKASLELLATTLIISTYEMLDNSTNDWERHLEGVFLIQRSRAIHGESGGLEAAVWWAWICQDVWAAFREKRKTLTFFIPRKPLTLLSSHELAARSVYITAKVVDFCAEEVTTNENIQARIDKANELRSMLDDWRKHLTIEFSPLPVNSDNCSTLFRPIWIRPPAFGVAVQFYCVARILLLSHEPSPGGLGEYLGRQRVIQRCVAHICGIALTLKDDASSLMSSQALFIAGVCTQDIRVREAILELLGSCRQRSGWPVKSLGDELLQLWRDGEDPDSSGQMDTSLQV